MNVFAISLIVVCLSLAILSGFLFAKNSVLRSRINLYGEFARRTNVKKFLSILEKTDKKVINAEMILMLDKYFELTLVRLEHKWIPRLLADFKKSQHSEVLQASFRNAAVKTRLGLFGIALSANITNNEDRFEIQSFLNTFPEEEKRNEYQTALSVLLEDYNKRLFDYPYEFRRPVEEAMKEFEAMTA